MAFISARMMEEILVATRIPNGRSEYDPAISCLMNPARTSRRWLTASASAGSSRSVGMKAWDQRTVGLLGEAVTEDTGTPASTGQPGAGLLLGDAGDGGAAVGGVVDVTL